MKSTDLERPSNLDSRVHFGKGLEAWKNQGDIRIIIFKAKPSQKWVLEYDVTALPKNKRLTLLGQWVVSHILTHPYQDYIVDIQDQPIAFGKEPKVYNSIEYDNLEFAVSAANKLVNLPSYLFKTEENQIDSLLDLINSINK